jgi:hypothetical protein
LDRYQLTPDQVGEIPLASVTRIPLIAEVADEIRKDAQEKANRG